MPNFRDDRCWTEDLPTCEMHAGEEVGTGSVVVVVAVCGRDQGAQCRRRSLRSARSPRLADPRGCCRDHVVRWRRTRTTMAANWRLVAHRADGELSEDSADPLVGQTLDETPQFVALGAHDVKGSEGAVGVYCGARRRGPRNGSTNCREPL